MRSLPIPALTWGAGIPEVIKERLKSGISQFPLLKHVPLLPLLLVLARKWLENAETDATDLGVTKDKGRFSRRIKQPRFHPLHPGRLGRMEVSTVRDFYEILGVGHDGSRGLGQLYFASRLQRPQPARFFNDYRQAQLKLTTCRSLSVQSCNQYPDPHIQENCRAN